MAENTRDAKLILRAEDRATKTFDAVAKSIAGVREQLQQQAKAAETGQGSLDDLQASYKALKQAGDDLVKQQAAINSFTKTSEAAERTAARVATATKALIDYQTKLAGQDKVTDSQTTKLDRLQSSVEKLTSTYNAQAARVTAAREALTALGLSADKTDEQLTATASSARQVAAGLLDAQKAIDGYEAGLRTAAAAAGELANRNKLLDEAAKVGVSTSAAQSNDEITAAIERQKVANDELAIAEKAEAAAQRLAADARASALKEIYAGNAILDEEFANLKRLDDEANRASAFRKIGEDAQAAATDLGRFGTTATESQASITRLADAIRSTVAPAVAEVQTLDGALKQVDESSSVAASAQKLRVSQYQDSLNKLTQAQAAFVQQAKGIDAFKAQQRVLAGLEADLGEAAEKYRLLGIAVARAGPDAEDLAKQLAAARRELDSIGVSTQNAGTKLEQLGNNLKRVGININDVDAEFGRLQAGATRSAATVEKLTASVGGNGKGFLGLKPYEVTNLSYQFNDVVTSLASGISPLQTLAQQGGQVAQIFPQVISTFVRLLPVILPAAAAIGLVAYQINETNDAAKRLKDFSGVFALSGNAADYSAQKFADAQKNLEGFGVSADDAKKVLLTFTGAGLNQAGLDSFNQSVITVSKTLGVDAPEAAQKFADAYSKGYDAVAELNDFLGGPLTTTELAEIKRLFDAGDAASARALAEKDLQGVLQATADKSGGEWQTKTSKLSDAVATLNVKLGLVPLATKIAGNAIRDLTAIIDGLKRGADAVSGVLDGLARGRAQLAAASSTRFGLTGDYQKQLAANYVANGLNPDGTAIKIQPPLKTTGATGSAVSTGGRSRRTKEQQDFIDGQQTELKNAKALTQQQRLQVAGEEAARAAEKAGFKDPKDIEQAKLNAQKIEQGKIDKENASAAKSADSAAAKAAREAETRQNKINSLTKELADTFAKFAPENVQDPYTKLRTDAANAVNDIKAKFAQLAKLGVTTVNGKTESDFEKQVASYEAEQEAAQRATDAEKTLNTLLEQRKTALAEIEDQVAAGLKTPAEGLAASVAIIDSTTPAIRSAGDAAKVALQALTPGPDVDKRLAAVAKQYQTVSDAADAAAKKAIANKDIKVGIDQLNALTGARDEYVKLENQLVAAGLETSTDAQKKIKDAYDQATPSIVSQAAAVQKLLDQAYLTGTVGYADYLKFSAQVKLAADETDHLTANQVLLKNAATQGLSSGIGTFITSIGSSLADAIKGTKSLGDVFKDIGNAALSFAASFTQAIAQAIIQIIALKAAQAILKSVGFSAIGLHEGGIVGQDATFHRKVPAAVFAGAVRYHTGGMVGLKPDEVPAILQKGEEVVTASDPRNRANGGLAPAPAAAPNIKIVNTIDAGEFVSQGANSEVGQKAILNLIGNNSQAVRAKLGLR